MRIVVASDHAGFPLKEIILEDLQLLEHEVTDVGTHDPTQPDDYPDYAELACGAILRGEAERGVIVCGSGVGICVAANKFPGIRAGLCHDYYSAHQGVEHDDMNVLCVGARVIGPELAMEIIRAFLKAKYEPQERHARRLEKVLRLEREGLRE